VLAISARSSHASPRRRHTHHHQHHHHYRRRPSSKKTLPAACPRHPLNSPYAVTHCRELCVRDASFAQQNSEISWPQLPSSLCARFTRLPNPRRPPAAAAASLLCSQQQRVFLLALDAALCCCSAVTVTVILLALSLVQDPSDRLMLVSRPAAVPTLTQLPLSPELSIAGGAA